MLFFRSANGQNYDCHMYKKCGAAPARHQLRGSGKASSKHGDAVAGQTWDGCRPCETDKGLCHGCKPKVTKMQTSNSFYMLTHFLLRPTGGSLHSLYEATCG